MSALTELPELDGPVWVNPWGVNIVIPEGLDGQSTRVEMDSGQSLHIKLPPATVVAALNKTLEDSIDRD